MKREKFFFYRDNDIQYQQYLEYWHNKAFLYDLTRPTVEQRILSLPDHKYRSYKNKAIIAKHRQQLKREFVPPRSNCTAFLRVKIRK